MWALAITFGTASLGAALLAALFLSRQYRNLMARRALWSDDVAETTVFLVDRGRIVDASPPARDFLSMLDAGPSSYAQLARHLREIFDGFDDAILTLPRQRMRTLASRDCAQTLNLSMEGARARIEIATSEKEVVTLDRGSHAHIEAELESLRALGDSLAFPAWRQSRNGAVSWANRAYLDLAREAKGADIGIWPPPLLFPEVAQSRDSYLRGSIEGKDGRKRWFDCRIEAIDEDVFVTAVPADQLVRAEATLTDFTQTFSRTFAHLTVGIAVFDRDRHLVMFNPALTELSALPPDLLAGRPRLESFLDALRARQMMPEPRDYATWRDHVSNLERAAVDGTYSEMWHLPGGRTYRVTGRPQVDGAFALLIEDISAEISLTRRFRAQIETGHAVLETLPDAICVFDRLGNLTMANGAYDRLWGDDTHGSLDGTSAADAVGQWITAGVSGRAWGEVREFLGNEHPEEDASVRIQLKDGRAMTLHMNVLPGGMRMVRFADARKSSLLPLPGTGDRQRQSV
ncbi:PAS-domain containing protein [Palleronia sp. LCG004]|uniref:PAS-domain containing protein n=1 Tax=Palleronia sp. LCG004 TaxID=3079304 RepID=UPI002942222A|nr:PAS-domain containing protein [Palleronia sp. LCG004]WOI55921.1 PAS-domain containing protein [Palleronia sp. LCG004]